MNKEFKNKFQPLFKVAWILTLIMIILIPIDLLRFFLSPPPSTVIGMFELFNDNTFLALLSLDLLYIINNLILVVIFLALFIILYSEKPTTSIFALTFGLLGNALYYPSNPAFEMLTLSKKYFEAQSGDQSLYLAAGEALMAGFTGTSFNVYYILGGVACVLFSYAILKSHNFKKSIGVWGMIASLLMIIPSSAGLLGMIFAIASLIPIKDS
jgi:hypothetical protein